MNVNVKLSLTDEERNTMFRRLTGKTTKGMVSRADVNEWVKEQLTRFLTLGSPTTEQVEAEEVREIAAAQVIDMDDADVEEVMRQNVLLQRRVNRLQHLIDTRGLKV